MNAPSEDDLTTADVRRQGVLVVLAILAVLGLGAMIGALADEPGPTWLQRAKNPNLGRPEVHQLLVRGRLHHQQVIAEGLRP